MKKLLLLLLFPLTLLSCSNKRVYGHYAFQMGSDKSTHFGVLVDLYNEDFINSETHTVKGKKFDFGMKFSDDIIPDIEDEQIAEDPEQVFLYLFTLLFNVEDNPDGGLSGYFNVDDKYVEEKGNRLLMTPVLDPGEGEVPVDLPVEILEYFIIAFLNKNKIDMIIPVSLDDVRYQLCWYGLFIDWTKIVVDPIEAIIDLDNLPGPQGAERFGSHPTPLEVEQMNNDNEELFKKNDFTFRDFNTLTVELLKE